MTVTSTTVPDDAIVATDLHGRPDHLARIRAAFPDRHLLLLGDYVGRGPDAPALLAALRREVRARTATLLLGNHDQMFIKAFHNPGRIPPWWAPWIEPVCVQYEQWAVPPQQDAAWLSEHTAHWAHTADGRTYFSHAAPHDPHDPSGGYSMMPAHLWSTPHREVRHPLGAAVTHAVHGHTPTHLITGGRAGRPLIWQDPEGRQVTYLDLAGPDSDLVAVLDLTARQTRVLRAAP